VILGLREWLLPADRHRSEETSPIRAYRQREISGNQ
jgi:hypothetical protein